MLERLLEQNPDDFVILISPQGQIQVWYFGFLIEETAKPWPIRTRAA